MDWSGSKVCEVSRMSFVVSELVGKWGEALDKWVSNGMSNGQLDLEAKSSVLERMAVTLGSEMGLGGDRMWNGRRRWSLSVWRGGGLRPPSPSCDVTSLLECARQVADSSGLFLLEGPKGVFGL
jgi:hypothetical protein